MVFQLQLWYRAGFQALEKKFRYFYIFLFFCCLILKGSLVEAHPNLGLTYLNDAAHLYHQKEYFKAARYAFAAIEEDPGLKSQGYAWITQGLIHAHLPHASAYFFIKTLQTGDLGSIQSVLTQTENLLFSVGADLIKKYLIRYTRYEDYDSPNRSAYLYALGKDLILQNLYQKAIQVLSAIPSNSSLWPYMLQMRGSALAITGKNWEAIQDFRQCADHSNRILQGNKVDSSIFLSHEVDDLRSRCVAGEARTFYQMNRFVEADRTYEAISKKSRIWPDILFEQAWNAFSQNQYNRALGKLVSYKSPALSFFFNSEIDVLRAQSFLSLCLYTDTNFVINEFNKKFYSLGQEIKNFVQENENDLLKFYSLGKTVYQSSRYTSNIFYQLVNRFIRGPYFKNLISNENQIQSEIETITRLSSRLYMGQNLFNLGEGFPGFLDQVLKWRLRSVKLLGGAFVKNSLIDYHTTLIDDFDKISFIKLEMINLEKDKLTMTLPLFKTRVRGDREPERRDDQIKWNFNGEFWSDELGDYVFGLESECKK